MDQRALPEALDRPLRDRPQCLSFSDNLGDGEVHAEPVTCVLLGRGISGVPDRG
jgi:hypothetical protein